MQWLKNRKVGQKIAILILSVVMFIGAVSFTGYYFIGQADKLSDEMYYDQLTSVKNLNTTRVNTRAIEANMKELILTTDRAKEQELIKEIHEREENIKLAQEAFAQITLDPYESEKFAEIQEDLKYMATGTQNFIALIQSGQKDEAYSFYLQNIAEYSDEANTLLTELSYYSANQADELNQQILQGKKQADMMMVIITLIAVGFSVTLGIIITKMVTNPMKAVMEKMSLAERGDMTISVDYNAKDELGVLTNTFNSMIAGMRGAIQQVAENANSLAASSEQISATTDEIARGSVQQADDASSSSEMVKEMVLAVKAVSLNAEETAQYSEATLEAANEGLLVIENTIEGMSEINEKIKNLANTSSEIGEIVQVIDGIAGQTNLLALNAAIEAARAGEAGKASPLLLMK